MKTFRKQPHDHLDYQITAGRWLPEGDEIVSAALIQPEGIEVTAINTWPDRVKVWVRGGTSGEIYKLTLRIHTQYRVKEVDFQIAVVDL